MSMMVSRTFGTGSYGLYFGAVTMVETIGQALGPLVAGVLFDRTGSYHSTFTLYIVLAVCSILVVSLVREKSTRQKAYGLKSLKTGKIPLVGSHNRVPSIVIIILL